MIDKISFCAVDKNVTSVVSVKKSEPVVKSDVVDEEKINANKYMLGAMAIAGCVALAIAGRKGHLGENVQKFLGGVSKKSEDVVTNNQMPKQQILNKTPETKSERKPSAPDKTPETKSERKPSAPDKTPETRSERKPSAPDKTPETRSERKPSAPDKTPETRSERKPSAPDKSIEKKSSAIEAKTTAEAEDTFLDEAAAFCVLDLPCKTAFREFDDLKLGSTISGIAEEIDFNKIMAKNEMIPGLSDDVAIASMYDDTLNLSGKFFDDADNFMDDPIRLNDDLFDDVTFDSATLDNSPNSLDFDDGFSSMGGFGNGIGF